MKILKGFKLKDFPFENLKKIGDLIFFDGPLMSVFVDDSDCIFIFDWADSDDENNRWLVYEISIEKLTQYLYKKISHYQLISSPEKEIIISVDIDNNLDKKNIFALSPFNLPSEYLPKHDILHQDEESPDLLLIKNYFKLNDSSIQHIEVQKKSLYDIIDESNKNNSEILNLHLRSSVEGIKYGKIYSSILGSILVNFHKLSENMAIHLFDDRKNKQIEGRRKHGELKQIKGYGEFEYLYAKAASFSIFLKPISTQTNLFSEVTSSEFLIKNIFKLFEKSNKKESLQSIKEEYDKDVMNSYKSFLDNIKTKELDIGIQWGNAEKNDKLITNVDYKRASKILNDFKELELEDSTELVFKGKFKALDTTNSTYKFETLDGEIILGKFSETLSEGMFSFNLIDLYKITLNRQEKSFIGKIGSKISDTIVGVLKE